MIDILTQNILELNTSDREQLFKVLSENTSILIKVLPTAPLLKYIVTGYTDSDNPVIQAYIAWKNTN
jgi:hypothetical protein